MSVLKIHQVGKTYIQESLKYVVLLFIITMIFSNMIFEHA